MPPAGTGLFSLRGRARTFRRSCGLDAGGEIGPCPRVGDFRPRRAGAFFCRLRRRGVHARRAGKLPPSAARELLPGGSRGFAKGGTGHPDLRPGFLYPLLRLPLTFRPAATPFGRAAKARGTQLRPLYHRRLLAAVWGWLRPRFPRITVRGSGAKGDNLLSGTHPPYGYTQKTG